FYIGCNLKRLSKVKSTFLDHLKELYPWQNSYYDEKLRAQFESTPNFQPSLLLALKEIFDREEKGQSFDSYIKQILEDNGIDLLDDSGVFPNRNDQFLKAVGDLVMENSHNDNVTILQVDSDYDSIGKHLQDMLNVPGFSRAN